MPKYTESPMVSVINEYFEAESLPSLYDGSDEESKQYDMGSNIYFEAVVPTTSKYISS